MNESNSDIEEIPKSIETICIKDSSSESDEDKTVSKNFQKPSTSKSKSKDTEMSNISQEDLRILMKTIGPDGLSFSRARKMRKNALKTKGELVHKKSLTADEMIMLNRAKQIIGDKKLKTFINEQMKYRDLLEAIPMTKEDHDRNWRAKQEKKRQFHKNNTASKAEFPKSKLKHLIRFRGPGDLSFPIAKHKREKALEITKTFLGKKNLTLKQKEKLENAKTIVCNEELKDFIAEQLKYRELLGINLTKGEEKELAFFKGFQERNEKRKQKKIAGEGLKQPESLKIILPSKESDKAKSSLDPDKSIKNVFQKFPETTSTKAARTLLDLNEARDSLNISSEAIPTTSSEKIQIKGANPFSSPISICENLKEISKNKLPGNEASSNPVSEADKASNSSSSKTLDVDPSSNCTSITENVKKCGKRKRSDTSGDPSRSSNIKSSLSCDSVNSNKDLKAPKSIRAVKTAKSSSTVTEEKDVDLNLRLVLVDLSKKDGKISDKLRLKMEQELLTRLSMDSSNGVIFFEGGWSKSGYRYLDCLNENSLEFVLQTVQTINVKDPSAKAIRWDKLQLLKGPLGWVWVPQPYITPDILIKLMKKQNIDFGYNVGCWSIAVVGKRKANGQYFLIRFAEADLSILEKNGMELRVGMTKSLVTLYNEDSEKPKEPTNPSHSSQQL